MGDGVLGLFRLARGRTRTTPSAPCAPGSRSWRRSAGLPPPAARPLAARVGIATGLVVVGELIGEGAAREEAVVGETPNLAARLQALAEPGTVVIAERTRRLVGGLFELADLGRQALKGFAEPVRAWRVGGSGHAEGRFEALRGAALTPLVGREQELALLLDRWARARDGEGQVVLLSGEPGIGKSRLVRALRERLADEPHTPLSYSVLAVPHRTARSGRWPSRSSARPASGATTRPRPSSTKLEALLGQATADLATRRAARRRAAGPAGGRPPPAARPEPAAAQGEARSRSCSTSSRASRRGGPCSPSSRTRTGSTRRTQELFDLVVERLRELPVLLLVTFRPEYRRPGPAAATSPRSRSSRLGRQQAAALAGRLAGERGLPDALVAQIVAKADGVPLFVEELTKAVLEAGAARRGDATPPSLRDPDADARTTRSWPASTGWRR